MEISGPADEALFREMNNASDRTAAIVATAFLDDKLTDLLVAYLRPDKSTTEKLFKPTGAIGALANKADLGFLLNLYSKEFRNDLAIISRIRNAFAHWPTPTTFDTKEIRKLCEGVEFQRRLFHHAPTSLGPVPFENGFARFWFISWLI